MDTFDALIGKLGSGHREEAIAAAHALGDLGDARAVPHLVLLLDTSDNHTVKNAAAVGLRELKDPAAIPPLLKQIRDPKNGANRGTFLYALGTLDARSTVVDLAEVVCAGNYEQMAMALAAIEAFQGPIAGVDKAKAIEILRRCLGGEPHEAWQGEMISSIIELLEETAAV